MAVQIQIRRGTAAQWANSNPVLAVGELGLETDTRKLKIGDGVTLWNSLAYGGALGPQGAQGFQGVAGSSGGTGSQGVQGAVGAQGADGVQGAQGVQGASGVGTQGAQGAPGSGTASGNDTEVQYNNSGSFAGADILKISNATKAVQFANTYVERYKTLTISTNTLTVNVANGTVFKVPLNSNINTFTITGTPAISDSAASFILITTADGTTRSINWGSIKWVNGTPPTMTSTNGKEDTFVFLTVDAGTNWYGFIAGQNL